MAPIPPHELTRELHAYDPALRIRWTAHPMACKSCGHPHGFWFIERRLAERHRQLLSEQPHPTKSARGLNVLDGWKQGYVHVLTIHPSLIDNIPLVLGEIMRSDIWRTRGVMDVIREIEASEEAADARWEKDLAHWSQAATSDARERLMWAEGNRFAVRTPGSPEVLEREGYVVRDRRTFQGGQPGPFPGPALYAPESSADNVSAGDRAPARTITTTKAA